jgi:hypothetical protein
MHMYFNTVITNTIQLTGATYGLAALKFSWLTYVTLRDLFTGACSLERPQT